MKKCTICKEDKSLTEYYKGHGKCKKCFIKRVLENDNDEKRLKRNKWRIENNYNKNYYHLNKEKESLRKKESNSRHSERIKKYYEDNKEKIVLKTAEYYKKNKEKKSIKQREYRAKNREKINAKQRLSRAKYIINPIYKIRYSLKERVRGFLKLKNLTKKNKTFEIVGITPAELKEYLEKQFKDGMSWDNYGLYGWHIDHIIPISSAKTEEELYKLCHYTNLQPLWAIENIKKSNKIL